MLLRKFASVELAISVDGVGGLQEYIRPPGKWDTICGNIFAFQKDDIPISLRPTVQAYNIFGMVELARWCEEHGLRVPLGSKVAVIGHATTSGHR